MKRTHKQSGSALVLALITTLVAFTLAGSLLIGTTTSSRISAKRLNSEVAFRVAEAGLNHAVISLKENAGYTGQSNVTFGAGQFTTTVADVPGKPYQRLITSSAVVNYARGLKVTRKMTALFDLGTPPVIGDYSIVSKGPLAFHGNAAIGSWPKGHLGDIASNTLIDLVGSVDIDGGASSAGAVNTQGAVNILGSVKQYMAPLPFPDLDYAALKQQARAAGTTTGNLSVGGTGITVVKGFIDGNLTLGGTGHIVLQSPVYVSGSVTINGGKIDGGTLISEGSMSASGHQIVSGSGTLALVTMSNFTLNGNASIQASVLAPNGDVSLGGNTNVFGTVASNTISMHGTPKITRNTNYAWPSEISGGAHLLYYQE